MHLAKSKGESCQIISRFQLQDFGLGYSGLAFFKSTKINFCCIVVHLNCCQLHELVHRLRSILHSSLQITDHIVFLIQRKPRHLFLQHRQVNIGHMPSFFSFSLSASSPGVDSNAWNSFLHWVVHHSHRPAGYGYFGTQSFMSVQSSGEIHVHMLPKRLMPNFKFDFNDFLWLTGPPLTIDDITQHPTEVVLELPPLPAAPPQTTYTVLVRNQLPDSNIWTRWQQAVQVPARNTSTEIKIISLTPNTNYQFRYRVDSPDTTPSYSTIIGYTTPSLGTASWYLESFTTSCLFVALYILHCLCWNWW